ncbi:hypothetical protein LTR95_009948 [Oleoguttula sp. CCFEE 5521]
MSRHKPLIDAFLMALRLELRNLQSDIIAYLDDPQTLAQLGMEGAFCQGVRDGANAVAQKIREAVEQVKADLGIRVKEADSDEQATEGVGPAEAEAEAEDDGIGDRVAKRRRVYPSTDGNYEEMPDADAPGEGGCVLTGNSGDRRTYWTTKRVLERLKRVADDVEANEKLFPQYLHWDFGCKALLDILEIMEREMRELADGLEEMVRAIYMSAHTSTLDSSIYALRVELRRLHWGCQEFVEESRDDFWRGQERSWCEQTRNMTYEVLQQIRDILEEVGRETARTDADSASGRSSGANKDQPESEAFSLRGIAEQLDDVATEADGAPPNADTLAHGDPDQGPASASDGDDDDDLEIPTADDMHVPCTRDQMLAHIAIAAGEFEAHTKVFPEYLPYNFDPKGLTSILGKTEGEIKELADGLAELIDNVPLD